MTLFERGITRLVACAFLAAVGAAEAQPLHVTYVGNAGVLVLMGEKKVLVDFRNEMETWAAPEPDMQIGAGAYLGQHPPGTIPVVFAPGVISTGNIHSRLEISPDGQEMLWNTVDMKTFSTQILSVKNVGGQWSAPQPPPFAKEGNSQGAVFSPDGKRLFFAVNTGAGWARRFVEKTEAGWSAAHVDGFLPSGSASFTRSGRVYLSREMKTKVWNSGIFEARYGPDGYADVTALGEAINRPNAIDYTPYVSPDESFLLFASNRPLNGDKEDMSIHVSFRKQDGTWSVPQRVSSIPGRFPSLSPDGKFLFFCGDDGNIYWVDRKILDPFRPLS